MKEERQGSLFEVAPRGLTAALPRPEHRELAARLPATIRLGAMTWSYKGWIGQVYGGAVSERTLAKQGLTAYVQHPLLRLVEIDRSYYEPLSTLAYVDYAEQVPPDFRFVVKAHEDCTVRRFPLHARYGARRGQENPTFLDPGYAEQVVLAPMVEGLGDKLGAVLFQFSPEELGPPRWFAERLAAFFGQLPPGIVYAVELRRAELLTPEYGKALAATGAVHCHNAWTYMTTVLAQARALPPAARRPLFVRWLLRRGDRFEDAQRRAEPFDRIVAEDLETRAEIAALVARAHLHGVPAYVLVDNKAEGTAPESIARLSRAIIEKLAPARE